MVAHIKGIGKARGFSRGKVKGQGRSGCGMISVERVVIVVGGVAVVYLYVAKCVVVVGSNT